MPKLTDAQIAYANSADLMALAKNKGYELKKVGSTSYHLDGFGGLYIDSEKNSWNCFAEGKGGGPIQFLMFIEQIPWRRAMDQLLQGNITVMTPPISKPLKKEPFVLPEKNNTFSHMIAYLLNTRKIDKEIVYHFIQSKQLYENDKKACVFVAYDEQRVARFASFRSTGQYVMKGNVANSDKHYVFAKTGVGDRAFIFESPIDLMSYLTLLYQSDKRNRLGNLPQHFISLEGLSQIGLDHYLERYPEIVNLTFCLDDDVAGQKAYERLGQSYAQRGYHVLCHSPEAPAKDFNEMLVNRTVTYEAEQQAEDDDELCLEYN